MQLFFKQYYTISLSINFYNNNDTFARSYIIPKCVKVFHSLYGRCTALQAKMIGIHTPDVGCKVGENKYFYLFDDCGFASEPTTEAILSYSSDNLPNAI